MGDSMLTNPAVRSMARELALIRSDLEKVKAGGRSTQMDYSSLLGPLYVRDPVTGDIVGTIGQQPDGGVSTVPVGGPPPPKMTAPILTPGAPHTLMVEWNGTFVGGADRPTNFAFGAVHASAVGPNFVSDPSNIVATLSEAGQVPIGPYEGQVWVRFVGYNTSTPPVTGEASDTVSAVAEQVVAQAVLDGIVDELALADDAVSQLKIKLGAVGTGQIAGNAVDLTKLADGSVNGAKLIDGAVSTPKIAPLAVTGPTIAASAVGTDKIAAQAVTADQVAANAVTAGAVAAGAVTAGTIAANAVTAGTVAANAVTAGTIAADVVTASAIAANAIGASELAANSVIAGKVAADAITATELAANSVGAEQIVAGAIQAGKIAAGAVTAGTIAALAVTAGTIATNAVTAGTIQAGAITAAKLAADLVLASRLIAGALTGTRAEMNGSGFEAWSGSLQTFRVNASNGDVMMLGTYKSAQSGERVEIPRGGDLLFYNSSGGLAGQILNNGSEVAFRGGNGTNAGHLRISGGYVAINYGNLNGTIPASFGADGAGIQSWGRLVGMRYETRYAGDGTEPRIFFVATNSGGSDINALHIMKRTQDNYVRMVSPTSDSGLAFVNESGVGPEVYVVNTGANAFRPIRASGFPVGSSEVTKTDVAEMVFPASRSSWDIIEGAPALDWRYLAEEPLETVPDDGSGVPMKMRVRNPDVPDDVWEELADSHPDKWIWEDMEPVSTGQRWVKHRFPLAEDLAALDPDLVREGVNGSADLAVDLRDLVGVHHDALDLLIKRVRLLEETLARTQRGFRLPPRPQRGDVAEGIGRVVAGRTRRSLDPETRVARGRPRRAVEAVTGALSGATQVPASEPVSVSTSGAVQLFERNGDLWFMNAQGQTRKVA